VVTLKGKRYGVDISGSLIRLVGREFAHGREKVDMLVEIEADKLTGDMINHDGELYMAVPEDETIIKKISIVSDRGLDSDKLAIFELSSSLMADSDQYYMESYGQEDSSERLAIAYRRERVDNKISFLQEKLIKPVGFRLRSWALAAGYRHYCRHEGGKLICLLDITANHASYCFIRDDYPVDIGSVTATAEKSENGSRLPRPFFLDLIATLKYRQMIIGQSARAVPLSLIIVTGNRANQELADDIGQKTGVRSNLPVMKKELFSDDTLDASPNYLVALGLMVD